MRPELLLLESDWCAAPGAAPSEPRSAARLYASLGRLLGAPGRPLNCVQKPLLVSTWQAELAAFARTAKRRGPNVAVLSTHGFYSSLDSPPAGHFLAAADGLIALDRELPHLAGRLKRTVLILDACHLGHRLAELRSDCGALGVIGFSGQVNWLASSVFVLALLRAFHRAGVFHMQRTHPARPRHTLEAMRRGEYAKLMGELGVVFDFAG